MRSEAKSHSYVMAVLISYLIMASAKIGCHQQCGDLHDLGTHLVEVLAVHLAGLGDYQIGLQCKNGTRKLGRAPVRCRMWQCVDLLSDDVELEQHGPWVAVVENEQVEDGERTRFDAIASPMGQHAVGNLDCNVKAAFRGLEIEEHRQHAAKTVRPLKRYMFSCTRPEKPVIFRSSTPMARAPSSPD